MPRYSMYSRAHAAMVLSKLRAGTYPSHSWDALTTCIYCGKRVKTPAGLSRHIALRPDCQAVRERWAIKGNPWRQGGPRLSAPLATRSERHAAQTDESSSLVAGPSRPRAVPSLDVTGDPRDSDSDADSDSDDGASGRPYAKYLPTNTTIAPVTTTRRRVEIEPRAYGPRRNTRYTARTDKYGSRVAGPSRPHAIPSIDVAGDPTDSDSDSDSDDDSGNEDGPRTDDSVDMTGRPVAIRRKPEFDSRAGRPLEDSELFQTSKVLESTGRTRPKHSNEPTYNWKLKRTWSDNVGVLRDDDGSERPKWKKIKLELELELDESLDELASRVIDANSRSRHLPSRAKGRLLD